MGLTGKLLKIIAAPCFAALLGMPALVGSSVAADASEPSMDKQRFRRTEKTIVIEDGVYTEAPPAYDEVYYHPDGRPMLWDEYFRRRKARLYTGESFGAVDGNTLRSAAGIVQRHFDHSQRPRTPGASRSSGHLEEMRHDKH